MKGAVAILFLGIIAASHAVRGDVVFLHPYEVRAISMNGSAVVRVTVGKWTKDGKREPKDQVSVYVYNNETDSFQRTGHFDLGDFPPSECLYVSDDGRFVVFANVQGHDGTALALRVYSADGKLQKTWVLSDLLSQDEIEACCETGSTIQWLEGLYFTKNGFALYGPASQLKGSFVAMTARRAAKENFSFSRKINLQKMEIEKR